MSISNKIQCIHWVIFLWVPIIILSLNVNGSLAQTSESITGTVTDANSGETLPGLNILVKGTSTGTSTNENGDYELTVESLQDTLVFSFIGYQQQTVPINGRTEIDIEMQSQVFSGEEMVVVGYGTQERQQITGSVSSVSSDEFVSGNVNNVSELIQGKIPGLVISNPGGNPNQESRIRLRGVSTFGANQEPLVVVNGIIGASLDNIDPNDIESIDVLKDASASAIYGTRGASGVILVTTKRGSPGRTDVNYNGSLSYVDVANRHEVLTGDEFRELGDITGVEILDFEDTTDWFETITQQGYSNIHNISISGGNSTTTYRVSGNFRDVTGTLKTTGFQQINSRLNLNHRALDNKLSFTLNFSGTDRKEQRGFDNAFSNALTFNPTASPYASDSPTTGGYFQVNIPGHSNPLATLKTGSNEADQRRFNSAIKAEYLFEDLIPGLSASAFYSFSTFDETHIIFYDRTNWDTGGATETSYGPGQIERNSSTSSDQLFESTLSYSASLESLEMELLGGFSYQTFSSSGTFVAGGDMLPIGLGPANLNLAQEFNQGLGSVSSYENTHSLAAGFGRINLNYDNTYFINSSIRREGSSRFGVNQKWGIFWSAGGGIELTNIVNFGEQVNSLRIRSSYGVTGQNAPLDGISKLRFGPTGNFYVGGEYVQSFGPVSNSNPDLKWEENKEFNAGVEFSVLDERLSGTVEYYKKITSDLLFETEVPVPPNLYPTTWLNVGELENTGLEVAMSYDVIRDLEVNWNTGVSVSTFNTMLNEFATDQARYISNLGSPGQEQTPLVRIKEGEPIGQIWGPEFAGIENGEWLFYNSEGQRVPSQEIAREDERVIGNALPDFTFSWNNSVNYKNWDLSVLLRGAVGHELVNTARAFFENPVNISTRNVLESALTEYSNLQSQSSFNSLHVENASFARLQNLSIGYTFPFNNLDIIRSLRLSLSGNNLFTITGYKGIDPEVRYVDTGDNNNPLAPGIERRDQWFTSRSFTFGVNLDF